MSARGIASCAVTVALLLAVQFVLGFVPGVELVTVLLACFCVVSGVACGMLTATAFSLLRCLLFGFSPNVVVLYLIYYNLFAALFGLLGRHRLPVWVAPTVLATLAVAAGWLAGTGVPVSALLRRGLTALLWTLFGICVALLALSIVLPIALRDRARERSRELAAATALACVCTVLFSLLDDVLTPLFFGYTPEGALAYFYASFPTMITQTICVALSVGALFLPLTRCLRMLLPPARPFRRPR